MSIKHIVRLILFICYVHPHWILFSCFGLCKQCFSRIHISLGILYQTLHHVLCQCPRLWHSSTLSRTLNRLFRSHCSFSIKKFFLSFFLWIVSLSWYHWHHESLFNLLPWSCISLHLQQSLIFKQNWIKNL